MRKRNRVGFTGWPSWRYGPNGEAEVFQCEEDVPDGWGRKPGETGPVFIPKAGPPKLDRADLLDQLLAHNVEINPQWGVAQLKKVVDDCNTPR